MDTKIILPTKKEEVKAEIVIPVVDKATFVYRKDTKMFAVLVPADKVDAFTAACLFDSVKMTYLQIVQSLMQAEVEEQSKIYKPGLANSTKNFINKFRK